MMKILPRLLYCCLLCVSCNSSHEELRLDKYKVLPVSDVKNISEVKRVIDDMYKMDQDIRASFIKDPINRELILLIKQVDQFHTTQMKKIILEHGWVNVSKFGKEYDHKAWLLIQHADGDPCF